MFLPSEWSIFCTQQSTETVSKFVSCSDISIYQLILLLLLVFSLILFYPFCLVSIVRVRRCSCIHFLGGHC